MLNYLGCAIPLLLCLWAGRRRAVDATPASPGSANGFRNATSLRRLCVALFWQLDIIGILLLITPLTLVLVPVSLAGSGLAEWRSAAIIAPLILGALILPFWVIWERHCDHPMVPPKVRRDCPLRCAHACALANGYSY